MSVVVARDQSTAGQLIFPWPNPVPWGAEIVCAEHEVAIICPNWEVSEKLGPGRHTISPPNPQSHVIAYFVNTITQLVPFERRISVIDRSTGQPAVMRFFGSVRIKVGDPELMCHQLVGLPYHDLTTGILRSADISVSKTFQRIIAKLCMAMATVSDIASPGAVAQLVNLASGAHPLAVAVTGLEFVRFEQFGLSVGNGQAVLWQFTPPAQEQGATPDSQDQDLDAPTTLDNIALLDPDEIDGDGERAEDQEIAVRSDANAPVPDSNTAPVPSMNPVMNGIESGANPSMRAPGSTGSNPALSPPTGPPGGPMASPPGSISGLPGSMPPRPAPPIPGGRTTTMPGGMAGPAIPAARNHATPPGGMPPGAPPAAMPGAGMAGPPPAIRTSTMPHGGRVQPTPAPTAGGRVQPTMPGGVNASPHMQGGRIQPTAPGGVPPARHSSPFLGSGMGVPMPGQPAPSQAQRRRTPPLGMPSQSPPQGVQSGASALPIGTQVLVYWSDGLWHSATIRQFSQGAYQVNIDGSNTLTWVQANQIRRP